ncbi:MAG: PBP1A family penicillin-binding protein [Candidatus Magasanikbacteria bacterium]|nr:PBP1A family penicillin-binding protein [Candidatus Magasanikbacteria bacterium]
MPIPPLKKRSRSYGFTDNDEQNTRTYGEKTNENKSINRKKEYSTKRINSDHMPDNRTSTKESAKKINWLFIKKILLLPFKLLWLILLFIWKLWKLRPKMNKETRKNIGGKIVWLAITGFVLAFLSSIILVAWANKDLPDPDKLTDRQVAQSTKIYDRTGEHLLYEIFADEKRTIVELDQIPDTCVNGVIATEDSKFYEHHGIRPLSILRAVFYGVFTKKRIAGTSTLTQQLVKNAILTSERSYTRKLKEVILSLRMEQKYSKDQILKIYFNEIPYGSTNYGIQSAAKSYFNKDVEKLNLQECATLAGLPKQPSYYLNDLEALKTRRDFVLFRMWEEGYITEEEKNNAQNEELTLEINYSEIKAPHFVLYVKQLLVEEFGEQFVETAGLKVITTLDWEKQQIAETAIQEESEKAFEAAGADNASLVAVDPKTGQILAMVGSRDFYDPEIDGQFNVATLGKRQPGSSFKPIVYTAAFEKGYTPDTVLFDVVTNFAVSGRAYAPQNYDLQEYGPITMRKGLQGSKNIPAVKTLYLVGLKNAQEFAERLGYTTLSKDSLGLTLVLGGGEVKLLEHVNAYATLANEGKKNESTAILKVEDPEGDVLKEWKKEKGEQVIDSGIAHTITNVLSDDQARAYAFGAGGILTLPGRPVAAKTGTTNNYIDAWTVGYTPSLVAGVWAGNTDNSPMTRGYGGSRVAAPIWNRFMREALADTEVEPFPAPPPNDAEKPALKASEGVGKTLKIDKVTGKLATTSTPEEYVVERTFIQPHSILHYVDKDDPRGPYPENPADDLQYNIWEAAIQDWIKRKKEEDPDWDVSFEDPPTEYDDAHSLELIPSLEIIYPSPSSTLNSRQIDTDIRVSAPRGVEKVTYRIDGRYVAVIKDHPFNLNYFANYLEDGPHTLTVIVEDDIGNRIEDSVGFYMEAGSVQPAVWFNTDSAVLDQDDFPKSFFLSHIKLEEIKEVNIYREKNGSRRRITKIDNFSNLVDNQIFFTWEDTPGRGVWKLIAEVELENGGSRDTDEITIEVR